MLRVLEDGIAMTTNPADANRRAEAIPRICAPTKKPTTFRLEEKLLTVKTNKFFALHKT